MNPITDTLPIWSTAQTLKTTNRGQGAGNQSLLGIKKLRELILELAVRGKLVPQDPNDEPASLLLEKIEKKKDLLIKDGKIRQQTTLPVISEDEVIENIPYGWSLVRLGDILQVINGRAYKMTEMLKKGTPLLRVGNLFTSNEWYYSDLELEPEKYIEKGDLIYAWSASFGPFIWEGGKVIYHYHIWKLNFFDDLLIDKLFMFQYLLSITQKIKASGNGIAMIHMTKERMEKLIIPIPPLHEQRRIVAKVDELMTLCDELERQQTDSNAAHETLVETLLGTLTSAESPAAFAEAWLRVANHFNTLLTTEQSIDRLKQTILRLAVMGKLVPQDPNDEPASVMLKKIAKEKARLVKEGKIKKQAPMPEISEDEKPFELPEGWEWVRLNDAIDVRDGTHDTPKDTYGEDTYPLVTSKNFENGEIKFEEAKRISAEDHFDISKRSNVERFDILFSMIGGNLGNQVMVNDDRPFSIKNVALFKYYNKEYTTPFFVKKIMEHIAIDLQNMAIGGAQPFVSLGFLRNVVIALPPLPEQRRIVAKVDELFALCDGLKAALREARELQNFLAEAVVEGAVR